MVCGGLTDRLEVAIKLVQLLEFQNIIKITKVDSDYFSKEYFADRPDCERLINKKLDNLGLNIMQDWEVALQEYIEDYYHNYL